MRAQNLTCRHGLGPGYPRRNRHQGGNPASKRRQGRPARPRQWRWLELVIVGTASIVRCMAELELGHGTVATPPLFPWSGTQHCLLTLDKKGLYVDAQAKGDLPRWRASFEWRFIDRLAVEEVVGGVAITIEDRTPGACRVELQDTSMPAVDAALTPFRHRIGTAPPPPTLGELEGAAVERLDDILFETREGGIEVWFSDDLAHDHDDEVEEFVEWLREYRGVDTAFREDREFLIALGDFSHRSLKRDVKRWWGQRVPGLRR